MSGILGRVELAGRPVNPAPFLASFDKLSAYGPDRSETWIAGSVAAGRHLLFVAPASRSDQLCGPQDGLIVVADAILDNRMELAQTLGHSFAEAALISDTELIRRSFVRWGEDCVHRLLGDFAFAVIQPEARRVFLARDHIGSRPLFWSQRNQTFLFSTAIESLVAFDEWAWSIDDRVIAEYLIDPLFPVSKPFFKQVHDVPAGGSVSVQPLGNSTSRWWRPSTIAAPRFMSAAQAADNCREILETSVRDRISTDDRIGTHFSGGIDSTGVAILASRALQEHDRGLVRAYAWSPPVSDLYPSDHARDERRRIQDIALPAGIPVEFGVADGANFLNWISRPLEFEGEADLADELPVLLAAKRDDVRILLSGWGGDEAFSAHGHGYLTSLVLKGRIQKAKRFAHFNNPSLRRPGVLLGLLGRQVLYPLLPSWLYRRFSPFRSYIRHSSFISEKLLAEHRDLTTVRGAQIKYGPDPNENLQRQITAGHVTMRMESWATWSAPNGFQYRYPLTDKRLLEFLFSLPPDQLFMNDQPRGLARAVLADCVPRSSGKEDIANERLRRKTRETAWQMLAQEVRNGAFDDACPWLDGKAYVAHALNPLDQSERTGILTFAQLVAATRVWGLYRRACQKGWSV